MEGVEKLEAQYLRTTGTRPIIKISVEDDELIPGCPAQVGPDDEITVSKELAGRDLIEAKAHEMGHTILRYQGLVAFEIADRDLAEQACGTEANQLCTEINNAISHRFLLPMLKSQYNIDSLLQHRLRCQSPECTAKILSDFEGDTTISHIEGIVAYDLLQCKLVETEQVELILDIDNKIRYAFELSVEHLSKIEIGMPIETQVKIFVDYLEKLGHPPKMFKIKEPPTMKAEHQALLNVELTSSTDNDAWYANALLALEKLKKGQEE